ncbi:MAG: type II toxin-antitoxin system HicA family toxin [Pyrinomonadaceae bacterium]|nr:type II toxin-antitoxin system HicA family toxin [Acidobacteriota bacterium]
MKRRDLIRHLESHNCEFVREGKEHTLYINRQTKGTAAVPRHRDIPLGTVRAICRALGVSVP